MNQELPGQNQETTNNDPVAAVERLIEDAEERIRGLESDIQTGVFSSDSEKEAAEKQLAGLRAHYEGYGELIKLKFESVDEDQKTRLAELLERVEAFKNVEI